MEQNVDYSMETVLFYNTISSDLHYLYIFPPITFSNVSLTVSHLSFTSGMGWLMDVGKHVKE